MWEIFLLVKKNKIDLKMSTQDWITKIEKLSFVSFVPMENRIAHEAVNLPGKFHKDPADRFIVATARLLEIPLITADKKILDYEHVKTIW